MRDGDGTLREWVRHPRPVVVILPLIVIVLSSCTLDRPDDLPDIIIGNITLSRARDDEQRYALALDVLNQTDSVLMEMTFRSLVRASVPEGEALETRLRVPIRTEIGSGVRMRVTATMESPFPVVSPGLLVLEEIQIGKFRFSGRDAGRVGYVVTGWIQYPWNVEETR